MKMVETFFFLGNTILAKGPIPERIILKHEAFETVQGTAFFCPECGEIWGRICSLTPLDFIPRIRRCRQHGNGIFLLGQTIWKYYPREILINDFLIMASQPSKPFYDFLYDWKRNYD